MSPGPLEMLRRFWPALVSLLVLALLWATHTLTFAPLAARYRTQLAAAGDVGASFDPRLATAPLPPRVTDLLRRNSIDAAESDRLSQSGFLATDLVRRISEAAVACGIDVVSSEPGSATQTGTTVDVRAHLRMRCRYAQFVELLSDLSAEHALYHVERISITPLPNDMTEAELWVTRVLLKRGTPR